MNFSPETLDAYPDMEDWLRYRMFPNSDGKTWTKGSDLTLEDTLVVIRRLSDRLDKLSKLT